MADIVKIYEVKMQGQKQVLDDSKKILKSFVDIKKEFLDLKAKLGNDGISASDLKTYNAELVKTKTNLENIGKQNERNIATQKALNSSSRSTNAGQISTNNIGSGITNQLGADMKTVDNMTKFTEALIRTQNEQTAASKRLQSAQTSLAIEESTTGKEIATVKMQTANARKQNRAAAEAEMLIMQKVNQLSESEKQRLIATVSLYSKVEMKMRTLQNEYKGLAIAKQLGMKLTDQEAQRMDFLAGKIDKYDSTLKAVDASMGRHQRSVANYATGFNSLNMSVAQLTREAPAFANSIQTGFMALSNNIPIFFDALKAVKQQNLELQAQGKPTTSVLKQLGGALFSWNTLLSVGVVLLTVYGKDIVEWTMKMFGAKKSIDQVAESQKILNESFKNSDFKKAVRDISELRNNLELAKQGFLSKDKVLKQYNETLGKVMGSAKSLNEVEQILTKNADNYIKATLYKAAANLALDKSAEEMLKAEQSRQKKLEEFNNSFRDATISGGSMGMGGGVFNAADYEAQKKRIQLAREKDRQDEISSAEKAAKAQENIAKKFMQDAAKFAKGMNFDETLGLKDDNKNDKPYRGSRLSGAQKDYLKDLEAQRNNELAILEKKFIDGKILEENYIRESLKINQNYYNNKIAYLKKGNAEERKQESQAVLDKAKAETEANNKLYSLFKKRYDDQLKLSEQKAKDELESVTNNPYSTEQQKLDAEKKFYEDSTTAQIAYNQNMIDLENELSKKMVDELNQRNQDLKQKLEEENRNNLQHRIKSTQAVFNVIEQTEEELTNQNEINAALAQTLILNDKNLSQEAQKIELERISKELSLNNINTELGAVIAKISSMDEELKIRKLTNEEQREYNRLLREKAILEGQKASAENDLSVSGYNLPSPSSGTSGLASSITNRLKDSRGIIGIGQDQNGADVDGSELIGEIIAGSFDLATQAMNNYFDAERQRVEQSKQLAYQRIDLEKEQLMRFAQSSAERESLEKQAAEKKKQADKEAGQRLKKIKKQELKLALATELANIGIAAAMASTSYGPAAPIMLPILYGMMALMAVGRYAINAKAVDQAQYGRGGRLKNGTYHSQNNGMPIINPNTNEIEAYIEKDEGIINKNSMADQNIYSVTGTPSQIASRINAVGGGVDWHGGATMKKFLNGGSYLGSRLQPPIFRSYLNSNTSGYNSQNDLSEVKQMIADLAEMQALESAKRVYVSQREMSDSQNDYNKQSQIATL